MNRDLFYQDRQNTRTTAASSPRGHHKHSLPRFHPDLFGTSLPTGCHIAIAYSLGCHAAPSIAFIDERRTINRAAMTPNRYTRSTLDTYIYPNPSTPSRPSVVKDIRNPTLHTRREPQTKHACLAPTKRRRSSGVSTPPCRRFPTDGSRRTATSPPSSAPVSPPSLSDKTSPHGRRPG